MKNNNQTPLGSCRGDDAKERILKLYQLEEVFHGIALNDEITGCCEDTPLAEYHRFDFKIRDGQIQTKFPSEGFLYVGSHCAKEFRKLMMERGEGHDYPALFNPLMSEGSTKAEPKVTTKDNTDSSKRRPAITVEGETALSLMMSLYPRTAENKGAILNIYNDIRNAPDKPLSAVQVKGINTSIGSYIMKATNVDTLVEAAQQVASARGEEVRNFKFPELSKALENHRAYNGYTRENAIIPTVSALTHLDL